MNQRGLTFSMVMLCVCLSGNVGAQEGTDLAALQRMADRCQTPNWLSQPGNGKIYFAPLEKIPRAERTEGQFNYTYLTDDEQYPANTVNEESQHFFSLDQWGQSIWLMIDVLTLSEEQLEGDVRSTWLMVAVPRRGKYVSSGQLFRYWEFITSAKNEDREVLKDQLDYVEDETLIKVRTDDNETIKVLTYLRDSMFTSAAKDTVDDFWELSVGDFHDRITSAQERYQIDDVTDGAYEHFLAFVELEPGKRTRFPINKGVGGDQGTGKAFGFLLDQSGDCLMSTDIWIGR